MRGGAEAAEHRDDAVAHPLAEAAREADTRALELRLVVEDVRPRRMRMGQAGRADETDERHEDRGQPDERLPLEEADQGEERVAADVADGVDAAAVGERVGVQPGRRREDEHQHDHGGPRTVATTDWRPSSSQ